MSARVRIILLNGVGSAGKSSIAKALQAIATTPFLHVAMDAFIDMLPEAYGNHPDAFAFEPVEGGGPPATAIRAGPVGERLMHGMRRAVAALADAGNDLIVDDVLLSDEILDYERLLAAHTLHRIGVFAPLDIIEARERARRDRMIGLARWQFDRVHAGKIYDLEVDTGTETAEQCALRIRERFRL